MKTKQEQIEAMAVIGCVRNPQAHTAEECAKCDFKQGQCNAYRHAKALYDADYRKIDKDGVVISREEYEMLANQYKNLEIKYSNLCDNYRLCKDANETLKQNVIIAYKETAEELIKAGYGDVSEYKAEIERLKSEYKQLQTNAEILAKGVRDLNHENYELTKKVKQSQIDTINTIVKYCENLKHWCEPKNCRLINYKSDDLQNFLNGIFEEVEDEHSNN